LARKTLPDQDCSREPRAAESRHWPKTSEKQEYTSGTGPDALLMVPIRRHQAQNLSTRRLQGGGPDRPV
jgi:hypothetical protein